MTQAMKNAKPAVMQQHMLDHDVTCPAMSSFLARPVICAQAPAHALLC